MMMISIKIPKDLNIPTIELDKDVREYRLTESQQLGDQFLANQFQFAIRVPSVVVPGEFNVLINPSHPDMEQLVIEDVRPFAFDTRFL